MKFEVILKRSRIVLGALLALQSSVTFGAGDGGGYHGPTWETITIPGAADRQISEKDVIEAVKVCYLTGDASRGIRSMADDLYEMIYAEDLAQFQNTTELRIQSDTGKNSFDIPLKACRGDQCRFANSMYLSQSSDGERREISFYQYLSFDDDVSRDAPGNRISVYQSKGADPRRDYSLVPEILLPILTADKIIQSREFDEMGEIEKVSILSGLSIQVPKEYRKIGSKVRLKNERTGQMTKATLNYVELVECLSGEIQRRF